MKNRIFKVSNKTIVAVYWICSKFTMQQKTIIICSMIIVFLSGSLNVFNLSAATKNLNQYVFLLRKILEVDLNCMRQALTFCESFLLQIYIFT